MDTQLLNQLDITTTELLQTIAHFAEAQFNKILFEGSCTGNRLPVKIRCSRFTSKQNESSLSRPA